MSNDVLLNQPQEVECKCFSCDFSSPSAQAVFEHSSSEHNLDIRKILLSQSVTEQLDYVKLVNFLRTTGGKGSLSGEWRDDTFLLPVLENDPLLYFDIEDFSLNLREKNEDLSEHDLRLELEAARKELAEARITMAKMKASVHKWLGEKSMKTSDDDTNDNNKSSDEVESDSENKETNGKSIDFERNEAMTDVLPVDSSYFCSYSGYSVHKDMLQDETRTMAYLNFVKKNRQLFEGKVVLDVGCGTGILSMFAVRYGGAKKVFAIEPSNMAFQAIETFAENGIGQDAITVINAPVESTEVCRVLRSFNFTRCDVVISEWMGYFLLFENMLPSVLYARDQFLHEEGCMAPSKAEMYLDATDSMAAFNEYVGFWTDCYGFKMSRMRRRILMDSQLHCFSAEDIVSKKPASLLFLDLGQCRSPPDQVTANFEMSFSKATSITAFVGWFDVTFDGGVENVTLSTAPGLTETHWKQSAFFLPEPVPVEQGVVYPCTASISRLRNDHRSLTICVTFKNHTYKWALCRD